MAMEDGGPRRGPPRDAGGADLPCEFDRSGLVSVMLANTNLSKTSNGRDAAQDIARFFDLQGFRRHPRNAVVAGCVDLSNSAAVDGALEAILAVLADYNVQPKIWKLQKNSLTPRGGEALAKFTERLEYPYTELHISHNTLGEEGVKALLKAMKRNRYFPPVNRPVWFRGEKNDFGDGSRLMSRLERDGIKFCTPVPNLSREECNRRMFDSRRREPLVMLHPSFFS